MVFLVFGLFLALSYYWHSHYNPKNRHPDGLAAPYAKYSETNTYANISALKHDIFKQLTVDLTPTLAIVLLMVAFRVIGRQFSDDLEPIIGLKEIVGIGKRGFSYTKFQNSFVGRFCFSTFGYIFYYRFMQPAMVNRPPYW